MRPQPLICARDVEASSRWYQQLLGCKSDHGGPNYERLVSDGRLVLQLHNWDVEHHHGRIGDPKLPPGNGVLLWFEVEDFDAAVARATALQAKVVLLRHRNPPDGDGGPNHWEIWLRDLDGYTVVLASPDGSADGNWKPERHGTQSEYRGTRMDFWSTVAERNGDTAFPASECMPKRRGTSLPAAVQDAFMIHVVLPFHLRNLARVDGELELEVASPVTVQAVLDALETKYPVLRGTIRDHGTLKRRPFIRYFACKEDLSLEPPETLLPNEIVNGTEPFLVVGAMAGG